MQMREIMKIAEGNEIPMRRPEPKVGGWIWLAGNTIRIEGPFTVAYFEVSDPKQRGVRSEGLQTIIDRGFTPPEVMREKARKKNGLTDAIRISQYEQTDDPKHGSAFREIGRWESVSGRGEKVRRIEVPPDEVNLTGDQ
jgi:hypothetical protein